MQYILKFSNDCYNALEKTYTIHVFEEPYILII